MRSQNKLLVRYGTFIGLAFIINLFYSAFYNLTIYSFESSIRMLIISIIMHLGATWAKMNFDKPGET